MGFVTPDVESKLQDIFSYQFFVRSGTQLEGAVAVVPDWSQAIMSFKASKWENCRLMARNALDRFVQLAEWSRSQEWNPFVREIRPRVDAFVINLVQEGFIPCQWVEPRVTASLCWDITMICLEHKYRDLVKPIFYIPYLDYWYSRGYFPCGWEGEEFPDHWDGVVRDKGRLMVF